MKINLVTDWRQSWRWASVRLSWAVGLIPTLIAAYPNEAAEAFRALSGTVRDYPIAAVALSVIAVAIPWVARIITLKKGAGQ